MDGVFSPAARSFIQDRLHHLNWQVHESRSCSVKFDLVDWNVSCHGHHILSAGSLFRDEKTCGVPNV